MKPSIHAVFKALYELLRGPRAFYASNQNPHTSGVAGFLLRLTMFNPITVGKAWRDNTQSQSTVASQLEQLMKHSQASRDARNHIVHTPDDAMNP